ncbi:Hydrolase [Flavobacterium sp. 9AF]|uniref:N-acetylmuramidase domain-containing protein n=1 Tax=Flavobacterium sp. 9AF TaxID=2653142 RepID=UPI0012F01AEA|nr:N-acetylmuramidase family protein [Flavobacterium sp. 9AF]VXB82425.1 Hydrolase [Flavobacterium sp. 9AF]
MRTIQYNNKAPEVAVLCDLLAQLGYDLIVSDSFTLAVDVVVRDFQYKNNLVVDGIVGVKTWSKLYELSSFGTHNNKLLSEKDLLDFATVYNLDLACVKAVNEVESSGKGFLVSGKPKILFEGHIFWKELIKRGIDPSLYLNTSTADVLYPIWTKKYYLGGDAEYSRLEKAVQMNANPIFKEAAYCAASWGCFQIMGFNAVPMGYSSVANFVEKMYLSEKEHLFAFGLFLKANHLIPYLQNKDWVGFASRYNGLGYKANKYDEKLANAYQKYS